MTIVRYDPFRDLRTLQEEVNRLFSTNLTRGFGEEGIGRAPGIPASTSTRTRTRSCSRPNCRE